LTLQAPLLLNELWPAKHAEELSFYVHLRMDGTSLTRTLVMIVTIAGTITIKLKMTKTMAFETTIKMTIKMKII